MKNTTYSKILLGAGASLLLSGCGAMDRISNIGNAPEMTKINNPVTQEGYKPVSLPMPMPKQSIAQNNSLWASDRQTFFKDQRANDVGDLITVVIEIKDKAELDNETERKRTSTETANLSAALGYEQSLNRILPQAIDPTNLIDGGADSDHKGTGSIDREEKIEVKLAALISQILPNGNMVIFGRQEVLVNFEKRILQIDGVIRPEDISVDNTISYEKIAEARITYGGEGQLSDVQQPRYGQQLYDVIFPF
jgi:flagellar L-ring protein precursor FlgH